MSDLELRTLRPSRRWPMLALLFALVSGLSFAGCSGESGGDDDASNVGDDDATTGDDDVTTGDDDATGGDDDASSAGDDRDGDGVSDSKDNCPDVANADQKDADKDGAGNACDACPNDKDNDADGDGKCADEDNCPDKPNADQADGDGDGDGDACDACPMDDENDKDGDFYCESDDNCPTTANADQADGDKDDVGDACDACPGDAENDADGDGKCADEDNCPDAANADQADADADGKGDACDDCTDPDKDGYCNGQDNCKDMPNSDQADADSDGLGDACDACPKDAANDADDDGACDDVDNCTDYNPNQMDRDWDGVGDVCDPCPDDADTTSCPEEPSNNPNGKFFLYGTYPDEGYQAVPTNPTGRLYFSQAYAGDLSKIHVKLVSQYAEEQPVNEVINLISDKTQAYFYLTLKPLTDYCMIVDIEEQGTVDGRWPLHHSACFTTSVPCGVPDNVGQDATIVKLGATSQAGLGILNGALESSSSTGNNYPVVLLMENLYPTTKFPVTFDVALGAFSTDTSTGVNKLMKEGYTSSLKDCSIDASSKFNCSGESAVLPLYSDGFGITVYVTDPVITAGADKSANLTNLTNFDLKGCITKENLERLFSDLGPEYTKYAAYVKPDKDCDGDGAADDYSFEITTTPKSMTLENAACPAP